MKILFWSAVSLSVIGLGLIFNMRTMPFGIAFVTSIVAFTTGTLITTLLSSLMLLRKKQRWKKALSAPLILVFVLFTALSIVFIADNNKGYTFLANSIVSVIPENNRGSLSKMMVSHTKEQWTEDIDYLKNELPKHHAYPFLYMQESDFHYAIGQLKLRLDSLNDREIAFEISKIVSMVKDGHTQVISIPINIPPFLDSRLFPIRIFNYPTGVYVTDGGRDNEDLTGMRILKIGNTNIEDVVEKINGYVPGENEYHKMQWSFLYLLNPQLLKHLHIIENEARAEFTFVSEEGKEVKKILQPILSPLYLRWYRSTLELDDLSGRNRLNENYWYEYSDTSKVLYLQINLLLNQRGKSSLKEFSNELSTIIAQHEVSKLIVDIRNCNGGDNSLLSPLLSIITHPKVNQSGKLYALIGRQTFSAAVSFLSALQRNTNVILVGEPAGSGANQCGDAQIFVLPHSRLLLQISSRFHQQGFYKDRELRIEPELKVKYTYQSNEKKDLGLEAIYSHSIRQEKNAFDLDSTTLNYFAGRYRYDVDKILTIKKKDGHLLYEIRDYDLFASGEMYPVNMTSFNTNHPQLSFQFLELNNNQFQKVGIAWASEADTLSRLSNTYLSPAELLNQNKIDNALTLYFEAKSQGNHLAATTEYELNTIGYEFMAHDDLDNALKLFEANTILFPFSGNAWDSLAELWLKKGDIERGKMYYGKSLELNPENMAARKTLKNLP